MPDMHTHRYTHRYTLTFMKDIYINNLVDGKNERANLDKRIALYFAQFATGGTYYFLTYYFYYI